MPTCREIIEKANSLIDGELSLLERLKIQFHLKACKYCRRYFQQLQLTISILGKLKKEESTNEKTVGRIIRCLNDRKIDSNSHPKSQQ